MDYVRSIESTIQSIIPHVLLALLLVSVAACEGPLAPEATNLTTQRVSGGLTAVEDDMVMLDEYGNISEMTAEDLLVEVAEGSANGIAVVITGSATFSHASVPELRVNARQTAGGDVDGKGRISFYNSVNGVEHTTDFSVACIKPISGWGRTNYGITMELDQPYSPWGGMAYTFVTISVSEDGHLDPSQVLNVRPTCGASISLIQPENRLTGGMQVILK